MADKMDEDELISVWILEFLLRKSSVDDSVVKLAVSKLPLPPATSFPLGLKQSFLLHTINSEVSEASIPESLLDHLESLEAIDALLGLPISASMKEAYCAVALDCTLRYLHIGAAWKSRYSAAVRRIWRGRILDLDENRQLVTADLRSWSTRLEAALLDEEERENLMKIDGRAETLRSLRTYLDEAYLKMGPSFLEVTARSATAAKGKNSEASEVRDSSGDAAGPSASAPSNAHGSTGTKSQNERQKVAVPSCKTKPGMRRHAGGGINIVDTGEGLPQVDSDSLPAPTLDTILGALDRALDKQKSSSLELPAAVQDPLPEAMQVAASLVPDAATTTPNSDALPQEHVAAAPDPEALPQDNVAAAPNSNDVAGPSAGAPHNAHGSTGSESQNERLAVPSCKTTQGMRRHSGGGVMIVYTEESGGGTPHIGSDYLPTPVVDWAIEKLKFSSSQNPKKRRRRKLWTSQEEEALREGVNKFGVGNWKLIRSCYPDVLQERTEVDLKDKWRNITR